MVAGRAAYGRRTNADAVPVVPDGVRIRARPQAAWNPAHAAKKATRECVFGRARRLRARAAAVGAGAGSEIGFSVRRRLSLLPPGCVVRKLEKQKYRLNVF